MLTEGDRAPQFSLETSAGGNRSLEEFKGSWLVVYFYPRDDTPGCTTEAKDFTAASETFGERNAKIIGVSKDTIEKHCKFIDKHALQVELLSDPSGDMIEAYGAWGEKNMYGKKSMGIVRSTVIVDPAGIVRHRFPKVRVKGHVDEVLNALDALQK
ncbi:MAG: peroxiredoxin [Myxococcota bacterium]